MSLPGSVTPRSSPISFSQACSWRRRCSSRDPLPCWRRRGRASYFRRGNLYVLPGTYRLFRGGQTRDVVATRAATIALDCRLHSRLLALAPLDKIRTSNIRTAAQVFSDGWLWVRNPDRGSRSCCPAILSHPHPQGVVDVKSSRLGNTWRILL